MDVPSCRYGWGPSSVPVDGTEMVRRSVFIAGATKGVGPAAAALFSARGWFVGIYDFDLESLAGLTSVLRDGSACMGQLDVSSREGWLHAIEDFERRCGRLDVLINNAGLISPGSPSSDLLERQLDIVDANLKGVIIGCQAAYPLLMQTPGALVVNMTASRCSRGGPAMATYAATQSAVRRLTEALDAEWRHHNVCALCMSPWSGEEAANAGSGAPVVLEPSPADAALTIYRIAALRSTRAKQGMSPRSASLGRGQDRIASNCDDWSGFVDHSN